MGMDDMLFINDINMLSEIQKLVPTVLDREAIDTTGFGRVGGTGGLGQDKSTEYWKKRRDIFTKTIGINFASRFIPIFIEHCEKGMANIKPGETLSMSELANTVTFEAICEILFGCDIRGKLDLMNYTDTNGNVLKVNLYECLMKISHDCSFAAMTPMNTMFPWLVHMNIGSENRRNTKNSDEFERVIKDICEKSDDKNSVYNQVINTGEIDKQTVYRDVMTIMFGGHETSSKSLCNALYKLKQYPEVEKKLMKELNDVFLENGKYTVKDIRNILTKEKLDQLDYLTYFVKELLRHDPPAVRSLGYIAKRPFKVDELLVPKNQVVLFNIYACHYNEEQWQDPMNFIPERFDPNSKYFLTPSGKSRHPLAYCPFTFGTRSCPGRALGMMELKVLIIFYVLTFDYEIDKELLENKDVSYAILSPFTLDIKVKAIRS